MNIECLLVQQVAHLDQLNVIIDRYLLDSLISTANLAVPLLKERRRLGCFGN